MNKETSVTPLENSNTRIWEKICETDPNRTKNFNKGYRGTAINPTYIYEKLTGCFGPCGIGWGFKIIKDEYKEGHEGEISHSTTVELWYKNGDVKSDPIPGIGGTQYVFQDKNGWHTDEDASKKSLTDALTKAAQLIGMSADIFSGLYEDCKYVAELRKKYNQEETEPPSADTSETPASPSTTKSSQSDQSPPSAKEDSAPPADGKIVTSKQAKAIYAMFMNSGFDVGQMKDYLLFHHNEASNYKVSPTVFTVIKGLSEKGELKPLVEA